MSRPREPISRRSDGRYDVHIDPGVRAVLAAVATQVADLLEHDRASTVRVFPPAYVGQDDETAAHERSYRELVDTALRSHHHQALDLLVATAEHDTISAEEIGAWLSAVETMRLTLGTRLDVGEELEAPHPSDPTAPEFAVYELLGAVQTAIVDALAAELPDHGRPEGAL
ncbi:MAG: DUF2017 family protein [Acidimicrobiales bacterium]